MEPITDPEEDEQTMPMTRDCFISWCSLPDRRLPSFRALLDHLKAEHPQTLPYGGDTSTQIEVYVNDKLASDEDIIAAVDNPHFYRKPEGIICDPGAY